MIIHTFFKDDSPMLTQKYNLKAAFFKIKFRVSIVFLMLLGIVVIPVLAQSQPYPTNAEIKRLRGELRQEIPKLRTSRKNGPGNWNDSRNATEIKTQENFVRSWSKVAPVVAPFLGEWHGQEDWLMIYPSKVKNQVCIISMPGDQPDVVNFTVSSVSNNQIRFAWFNNPSVVIKEQEFLGLIYVQDNKASLWLHTYPSPLKNPSSQIYDRNTSKVVPQFKKAGCTASLPNS